jgi:hypothetical protein
MNFTIFLNSRGRHSLLEHFIHTVEQTTKNVSQTELIIRADYDDNQTVELISNLKTPLNFVPIIGPRPKSLCGSYNEMANIAKGQYLFVMNDDAEISVKNWDELALNYINKYKIEKKVKDDIIYGLTSDTSVDKPVGRNYASFPIISSQAVQALGFFMPTDFVGLGGDSVIYRIYDAVDRIVDMTSIVVDHVYHNTIFKVISPDITAAEMRMNSYHNNIDPFSWNVDKDIEKLKDFINKKNV